MNPQQPQMPQTPAPQPTPQPAPNYYQAAYQQQPTQQPQAYPAQPQYQVQPTAPQVPQMPQPQPTQAPQPVAYPQSPVPPAPARNTPTPLTPAAQNTAPTQPASNPNSTQATLLISELRDGLVIMKDGSFRAVIACKSINFDLMSTTEREGVEFSYQNFINSLTFPTQILVRSQRVDIGPYLERLTTIRKNNDNMLLGVLMDDYINFVDVLSQEANIMDKSFFVIIPYYTSEESEKMTNQAKNFFTVFSQNTGPQVTKIDRATYDKAVSEINNRVESVISGLFQIGIHSVRLNTRELSELYYNFNNPDTAVREPFIDFSKMATTYVTKGPAPSQTPTNQGETQNA